MYRYTTSSIDSPVNHADHTSEQWHGYLNDLTDAPAGVNGDSTGLCCHDCQTIVVDVIA